MGLSTLLGLGRQGFFIPYRHAATVRPAPYPALEPLFENAEPRMAALLDSIDRLADALHAIDGPPPQPRWDQDWFPRLDAAALYAIVRERSPRRLVEIGSGHSTRFAARAVADGGLSTTILCIDPAPRADLTGLPIRLERRLLEPDMAAFAPMLGPGDVLLVDSSHVAMPGSDVDRIVNDLLPRLPTGVLLHVHDVVLPDAYPPAWQWREYGEQMLIGALLQGGAWRILWSSHWLAKRRPALLASRAVASLPLVDGAMETSLWLEKVA